MVYDSFDGFWKYFENENVYCKIEESEICCRWDFLFRFNFIIGIQEIVRITLQSCFSGREAYLKTFSCCCLHNRNFNTLAIFRSKMLNCLCLSNPTSHGNLWSYYIPASNPILISPLKKVFPINRLCLLLCRHFQANMSPILSFT